MKKALPHGLNSLLDSCGMNDEDQAPAANLVEDRKRCLQQGIQDVGHLILDEFNLDTVLGKILETIYRGIGFDKVVIFIKDLKTGRFQARYALGAELCSDREPAQFCRG